MIDFRPDGTIHLLQKSEGSLRYQGRKQSPPFTSTFLTFGFAPTTATLVLEQAGPLTVESDVLLVFPDNIAETYIRVPLVLRVLDAEVNGTPLDVGPNCRTVTPLASPEPQPAKYPGDHLVLLGKGQLLNGTDATGYVLTSGGPLTGEVTVPAFKGCGAERREPRPSPHRVHLRPRQPHQADPGPDLRGGRGGAHRGPVHRGPPAVRGPQARALSPRTPVRPSVRRLPAPPLASHPRTPAPPHPLDERHRHAPRLLPQAPRHALRPHRARRLRLHRDGDGHRPPAERQLGAVQPLPRRRGRDARLGRSRHVAAVRRVLLPQRLHQDGQHHRADRQHQPPDRRRPEPRRHQHRRRPGRMARSSPPRPPSPAASSV